MPDGEFIKVLGLKGLTPSGKDVPADAYRRDFVIAVNYASISSEKVYPVLVLLGLPISDL